MVGTATATSAVNANRRDRACASARETAMTLLGGMTDVSVCARLTRGDESLPKSVASGARVQYRPSGAFSTSRSVGSGPESFACIAMLPFRAMGAAAVRPPVGSERGAPTVGLAVAGAALRVAHAPAVGEGAAALTVLPTDRRAALLVGCACFVVPPADAIIVGAAARGRRAAATCAAEGRVRESGIGTTRRMGAGTSAPLYARPDGLPSGQLAQTISPASRKPQRYWELRHRYASCVTNSAAR